MSARHSARSRNFNVRRTFTSHRETDLISDKDGNYPGGFPWGQWPVPVRGQLRLGKSRAMKRAFPGCRGHRRPSGGKVRAGNFEVAEIHSPARRGRSTVVLLTPGATKAPIWHTYLATKMGHRKCRGRDLSSKDSRVFMAEEGAADRPCQLPPH